MHRVIGTIYLVGLLLLMQRLLLLRDIFYFLDIQHMVEWHFPSDGQFGRNPKTQE